MSLTSIRSRFDTSTGASPSSPSPESPDPTDEPRWVEPRSLEKTIALGLPGLQELQLARSNSVGELRGFDQCLNCDRWRIDVKNPALAKFNESSWAVTIDSPFNCSLLGLISLDGGLEPRRSAHAECQLGSPKTSSSRIERLGARQPIQTRCLAAWQDGIIGDAAARSISARGSRKASLFLRSQITNQRCFHLIR